MSGLDRVRALDIVLTAACNLRCSYCYQNDKGPRRMEWETLERALDLALATRRPQVRITFYGGEPLLQFPLIRRAVDHVERHKRKRLAVEYTTITNGTLLGEEQSAFLAEWRVKTQLSFDGVREAQALRDPRTFDTLDALLDRLRRDHPVWFHEDLRIGMTVLSSTLGCFADSVAYLLKKGVRDLVLAPLFTHDPSWRPERIEELRRAFDRVRRVCLAHYRRTGRVPVRLFRKSPDERPAEVGEISMCGMSRGEVLAVDVDGTLEACVTFVGSFQRFPSDFLRDRLGSLRLGKLGDPLVDERLAGLPAAAEATGLFHSKNGKYSSYGRCADCRYLMTCDVCPVSIGKIPGNTDPDRVPDFLCAYNLVANEQRERFPAQPVQEDAFEVLSRGIEVNTMMRELEAFVRGTARREKRR